VLQLTFHTRYIANRQPGKALQFFLRLRRPNVFDLIRENNLFTDVRDQALLLIEFDQELFEKQKKVEGAKGVQLDAEDATKTPGITLLVDHTHSIPAGLSSASPGLDSPHSRSHEWCSNYKLSHIFCSCTCTLSLRKTLSPPWDSATCRFGYMRSTPGPA